MKDYRTTQTRLLKRKQWLKDRLAHVKQRLQKLKKKDHKKKPVHNAGALRAIDWAHNQIGITEKPANSNRGPKVDVWEKHFGMVGQPWCGAFVGMAIEQGGANPDTRIVFTPYIIEDAKAKRNGFEGWYPVSQAKPGDLALYNFDSDPDPEHVELIVRVSSGTINTIGGNTSSDDSGSQSNGGGVFAKTRATSLVIGVARPLYKS